jgi:hypothetical protein
MILFLAEATQPRVETIGNNLYLTGIFATADQPTRNGRSYPKHILSREIAKLQDKIRGKNAFAELGHSNVAECSLERACGLVESLRQTGNSFHGRIKILETHSGNIVRALINGGCRLGVSSKGFGSTRKVGGVEEVCEDYSLKGWDVVSDPACPQATLNAVSESIKSGKLSLNESVVAMQALKRLGRPELVAAQEKYGYDFDGKAGNQFRGHSGFPSIAGDDSTYYERLMSDLARILAQLADLNNEVPIDNEGLEKTSLKKYLDGITDPIERASVARMYKNKEVSKTMVDRAVQHLKRVAARGDYKAGVGEEE